MWNRTHMCYRVNQYKYVGHIVLFLLNVNFTRNYISRSSVLSCGGSAHKSSLYIGTIFPHQDRYRTGEPRIQSEINDLNLINFSDARGKVCIACAACRIVAKKIKIHFNLLARHTRS